MGGFPPFFPLGPAGAALPPFPRPCSLERRGCCGVINHDTYFLRGRKPGGDLRGEEVPQNALSPPKKNIYQPGYSTPHPPLSPSLLAGASGGSRHLPFLLCPQGGVVTTPGPRQGGIEAMAPHLVHCPPPRPPHPATCLCAPSSPPADPRGWDRC